MRKSTWLAVIMEENVMRGLDSCHIQSARRLILPSI